LKYEKVTKVDRNKAIYKYYKEHPEMSLSEIAERFNITRQRVHQIVSKNHFWREYGNKV